MASESVQPQKSTRKLKKNNASRTQSGDVAGQSQPVEFGAAKSVPTGITIRLTQAGARDSSAEIIHQTDAILADVEPGQIDVAQVSVDLSQSNDTAADVEGQASATSADVELGQTDAVKSTARVSQTKGTSAAVEPVQVGLTLPDANGEEQEGGGEVDIQGEEKEDDDEDDTKYNFRDVVRVTESRPANAFLDKLGKSGTKLLNMATTRSTCQPLMKSTESEGTQDMQAHGSLLPERSFLRGLVKRNKSGDHIHVEPTGASGKGRSLGRLVGLTYIMFTPLASLGCVLALLISAWPAFQAESSVPCWAVQAAENASDGSTDVYLYVNFALTSNPDQRFSYGKYGKHQVSNTTQSIIETVGDNNKTKLCVDNTGTLARSAADGISQWTIEMVDVTDPAANLSVLVRLSYNGMYLSSSTDGSRLFTAPLGEMNSLQTWSLEVTDASSCVTSCKTADSYHLRVQGSSRSNEYLGSAVENRVSMWHRLDRETWLLPDLPTAWKRRICNCPIESICTYKTTMKRDTFTPIPKHFGTVNYLFTETFRCAKHADYENNKKCHPRQRLPIIQYWEFAPIGYYLWFHLGFAFLGCLPLFYCLKTHFFSFEKIRKPGGCAWRSLVSFFIFQMACLGITAALTSRIDDLKVFAREEFAFNETFDGLYTWAPETSDKYVLWKP